MAFDQLFDYFDIENTGVTARSIFLVTLRVPKRIFKEMFSASPAPVAREGICNVCLIVSQVPSIVLISYLDKEENSRISKIDNFRFWRKCVQWYVENTDLATRENDATTVASLRSVDYEIDHIYH